MQVTKTLVVGLGSTGTQICEMIADRIRWELGSLERAPWVRFLCLETNATVRPEGIPEGDFVHLGISASAYATLVSSPQVYDQAMQLTRWADMSILKALPTGGVTAGAGHIRMVGRLAFLYPDNYKKVLLEFLSRLQWLRSLSHAAALAAIGDDNVTHIEFANAGKPVIHVVGTLCGGTCSGIVSDFGFFAKAHREPGEDVLGFFTIPRADLTSAVAPKAESQKKNAYSALVELNQYHIPDWQEERDFSFPDGTKAPLNDTPYGLPYIASPKGIGTQHTEQLNLSIADYIFLTVFVPALLPQTAAVDAKGKIVDLSHQAHSFCGFGLSTIEFPAPRIIEACTYRMCSRALGDWLHRSVDEDDVKHWLADTGLEWERLKSLLFSSSPNEPGAEDQRERSRTPLFEQLKGSPKHKMKSLVDQLRKLYDAVTPEDESPTARGTLYQVAQKNRQAVAEAILERIRSKVANLLGDYNYGSSAVEHLLKAVVERLKEMEQQASGDFSSAIASSVKKVNSILASEGAEKDGCLSRVFPFRARKVAAVPMMHLLKELEGELDSREDALLAQALRDEKDKHGNVLQAGIVGIVLKEVELYRKRALELSTRLATLRNSLSNRYDNLAREKPNVNGVVLFEPEVAGEGTVDTEYKNCLHQKAGIVGKDWKMVEMEVAKDIVSSVLGKLAEDITRPSTTPWEKDWLLQPPDTTKEASWLPREVRESLMERAREPFERLRFVDVLERWTQWKKSATPEAIVQDARKKASLYLDFNEQRAIEGERPPVLTSRVLLVPPASVHRETFLATAKKDDFMDANVADCPDPYRAVFIQNYFRFPLRGVVSVTGEGGIAYAQSQEYPTFFSRKDVFWVGVTEEESRRLRRAENLIAVGLMLGILEPKGGSIQYRVAATGFGDDGWRRLPLSIRRAAVVLSQEDRDVGGRVMHDHMNTIQAQIQGKRKEFAQNGGDRAFVEFLNQRLIAGAGAAVPDWDQDWLAERLMRYCGSDPALLKAYDAVFPPDLSKIAEMKRKKDEPLPQSGKPAPEDGIYCPKCGGKIGATEEEAAANGWRCFVNPDHYFGQYIRK